MNAILWIILAAAGVPDVTAGPDLAEAAVLVEAPIDEVTVYSDRARVRRRAEHALTAGNHTLRLPDLPGAVMMNTVRVGCSEARVIRVEAVPIERERFSIEQVEELIQRLEGLTDKLSVVDAQRAIYQMELSLLASISPRAPVPEQERVGKALPAVEPDIWKKVLDFLQGRRDAVRSTIRSLDERRRLVTEDLARVQREVGRHDLGAFTDRKVQVLAIVRADSAVKAKIELEYFIPGAYWMPVYDLTYESDTATVNLRTAGMVQQASGEDWTDVQLQLSTAIPGQGIDLPKMLTWALGEKKEFIPRARAARMPASAPRFPPPRASKTPYEAAREAKLSVLQGRISSLQGLLAMDARSAQGSFGSTTIALAGAGGGGAGIGSLGSSGYGRGSGGYDFGAAQIDGALARPEGSRAKKAYRRPSPRPSAPPPPPMAPMAAPAREEMVMAEADDYEMADQPSVSTRSSVRGRRGPSGGKMASSARVAQTSLGLFEPTYTYGPQFNNALLPAVIAGGLDYVYSCPTRMTIPSSSERIAVPVSLDSFPAKVFYEATPALKETAYLKAEVTNKGERPILGGEVNIFMGPDFAGQGRLQTTGPGGVLPLPLGADENIRLKRVLVPKTETEGVFSKDEVTTYTVTLEVGNYKKRSVRIAIIDQVPKSGNEEIEIEMLKKSPDPLKGPDHDGVMRWELDIPAGQTKKIEFRYKITRPENWQLHQ